MMEKRNNIFPAGGDSLVYLSEPMPKNISQHLFGAMHLVRTYLMTDFSTPLPLYVPTHTLDDLLHLLTFCILEPYPSKDILTLIALL